MNSDKKFYRTVITVEVLHEHPRHPHKGMSLADVDRMISGGSHPCAGKVTFSDPVEMNAKEAAQALIAIGEQPEWFAITEDGDEAGFDLREYRDWR